MTNPARAARCRSRAYAVLASLFRQPDSTFLAWLAGGGGERTAQGLIGIMSDLRSGESLQRLVTAGQSVLRDGGHQDLVVEYNRLFSPLPTVQVPLWASAYAATGSKVMGEPARLAQEFYARAGVSLAAGSREHPDHLTVQLRFVSRLGNMRRTALWRRQPRLAARWAALEQEFLSMHLASWVLPNLIPRLKEHAGGGFYAAAGLALSDLLSADLKPPKEYLVPITACGQKRRPSESLTQVSVTSQNCTLCGVCSGACPTGALRFHISATKASLRVQDDLCNSCGLCTHRCPERAISLDFAPLLEHREEPARLLAQTTIAKCNRCQLPLGPRSMINRTARYLGTLVELCPGCRLGTGLSV